MSRVLRSVLLAAAQVVALGSVAAADPPESAALEAEAHESATPEAEAREEEAREEETPEAEAPEPARAANLTIHACSRADGEVVYQDAPCPEPPTVVVEPPQAPKPPEVPKPLPAPAESKSAQRAGPIDARWETPRKTLKTFLDAVTAGDRFVIWDALTSSASLKLAPEPAALPLEKLRETVRSFTSYVDEGDVGPYWSIRALRPGTLPKWILFEKTGTGEWKIAGF